LKEQVFEPQTLVAVQVTVFVPRGNTLPLAGAHSTSAPLVTAGLENATGALVPQVVFVKDAGQARLTAGICVTVTLKEQVFEPQTLVAVQITVFAPKGNTLALAGTHATSAPSATVGLANVTTVLVPQVVFVKDAGQAMVTAGIWITVRVKEQVFVTQVVAAVQVTVFVPRGNTLPLTGTQPMNPPAEMVGLG
jgi:hypothetical protein